MDTAPRPLPYARSFFYQRTLVILVIVLAAIIILVLQAPAAVEWMTAVMAVLFAYFVVVGLSPLLTKHTLARSRIILRQGWYFRCVVTFSDVEAIGPYDGDPKYGLRLSPARGTLYVVGGKENLVAVRLRQPRRFPQVLFLSANEIVFDVDDREAFLAAVTERRTAGPTLPARKVPVLPPARR